MRDFINRISSKLSKFDPEQVELLLESLADKTFVFSALIDSLATGLIICDNDWHILINNKAAERLIPINFRNADLLHNELKDDLFVWNIVIDKDISDFLIDISKQNKINISKEFVINSSKTSTKIINISILPLVYKHKLEGNIIQIEDITEKRNQEILLRRMDNLSSLTNVAANVAHEIKNPLGSISIYVQLLKKSVTKSRKSDNLLPNEDHLEKYIEIINEEIERLNKIVVDFLFAVRPVSASIEPTKLEPILEKFKSFLLPECKEKNIDFILECSQNLPPVMIDEKLFKQVLHNLAQNSIAALKDGGFFIIKVNHKDDKIYISFADNGCGMDEETQAKIFEPYFTTKITGTGLGLTMVYKIIREFGGDIEVKSAKNEGTVFIISLPCGQDKKYKLEYHSQEKS